MAHNDCKDDDGDGGDLIFHLWYPLCQKMALQSRDGWCIRGTVISHSKACWPLTSQEPCDYRISAKGEGGVDHCPLLLIYSSFMIRDQSRQSENQGLEGRERSREEDRAKGGERSDYELSGPSHAAGLTEHIMSEYKYTLHSCPLIWHHGFPPWCSTTNVLLHFCVPNRKSVKGMSLRTQVNQSASNWKRDDGENFHLDSYRCVFVIHLPSFTFTLPDNLVTYRVLHTVW